MDTQGVFPVLPGLVSVMCCMVGRGDACMGSGSLVPVTGLCSQASASTCRARALAARPLDCDAAPGLLSVSISQVVSHDFDLSDRVPRRGAVRALDQSALLELPEALKAADADGVVRQALQAVPQALTEAEATAAIGAAPHQRTSERTAWRNGHRDRLLTTAAGDIELKTPKLWAWSVFPSLLERRRRIDRASSAVVTEACLHGVAPGRWTNWCGCSAMTPASRDRRCRESVRAWTARWPCSGPAAVCRTEGAARQGGPDPFLGPCRFCRVALSGRCAPTSRLRHPGPAPAGARAGRTGGRGGRCDGRCSWLIPWREFGRSAPLVIAEGCRYG